MIINSNLSDMIKNLCLYEMYFTIAQSYCFLVKVFLGKHLICVLLFHLNNPSQMLRFHFHIANFFVAIFDELLLHNVKKLESLYLMMQYANIYELFQLNHVFHPEL